MYELTVISGFAAAHNLRGYEGACERLHGHNWKVEVVVAARTLDDTGLVVDFKILKRGLKEILAGLDHRLINEVEPFGTVNPSSENLARFIYMELTGFLRGMGDNVLKQGVQVRRVTVWESENAGASYYK